MPTQKAKDNYLGKNTKRLNCAQAVLAAFKEKFGIEEEILNKFAGFGGGNAPDGVCGAYYSAKYIIEKVTPEKINELDTFFVDAAKSLKCKEIRGLRKLSCLGCVEKAAEFLEKN